MSKPFWFAERKAWYLWVTRDGKRSRIRLSEHKTEAMDKWKAILIDEKKSVGDPKFAKLAIEWLKRQKQLAERGDVSKSWYRRVKRTLESFSTANPKLRCSQITVQVVRDWLGGDCAASYEHSEVSTVKRVIRDSGASSPVLSMKLSKGRRRESVLTIEQHRAIVAQTSFGSLRLLLWCLWYTGARPDEMRRLTWEELTPDCSRAILREHKTRRRTNKPRTIYFPPNVASVLNRHRNTGTVFLNSRGRQWTKDSLRARFSDMAKEAEITASPYTYRHTFATRAMSKGIDVAIVAELLGTSVKMLQEHYGHLDKQLDHLAEAARRI